MSLYSKTSLKRKIDKLSKLYDMTKPRDVFTLTMQEMEVAEATAISKEVNDGAVKKQTVLSLIESICDVQKVNLDLEWVASYIDDMSVATKCKYAINKAKS